MHVHYLGSTLELLKLIATLTTVKSNRYTRVWREIFRGKISVVCSKKLIFW